jgi:uncharacterized protein (DUF1330 family)
MDTIRQKLLEKYWKKAFDFATSQDYEDIDNAEDRYKKWMEIQELYRIAVKEVIDDICGNYVVKEKKKLHYLKVNNPQSSISDEELQKLKAWLISEEGKRIIREAQEKADADCKIIDKLNDIDPKKLREPFTI